MILSVFKTDINTVSFLPVFKLNYWCFQQPNADSGTRAPGKSGIVRVLVYDLYWRTQTCLLCIFVPPPTVPLQWVVNSGSFDRTQGRR